MRLTQASSACSSSRCLSFLVVCSAPPQGCCPVSRIFTFQGGQTRESRLSRPFPGLILQKNSSLLPLITPKSRAYCWLLDRNKLGHAEPWQFIPNKMYSFELKGRFIHYYTLISVFFEVLIANHIWLHKEDEEEGKEDCSHRNYRQLFSALGLYLEPLTQHVSAPLLHSSTRPLIAWISCCFNRLIHLLCLFTSSPLSHTFSRSPPPSVSLSLCSWAITQTNTVCFPLSWILKGKNERVLWFWFKVKCIILSLRRRWSYSTLAMQIYVNSCQISLSPDWPELRLPPRQSLKPNLTIKVEEGRKGSPVSWRRRCGSRQPCVWRPPVIQIKPVHVVTNPLQRTNEGQVQFRAQFRWSEEIIFIVFSI